MTHFFLCSLIHYGVLGGGLIVDGDSVTYKTTKLTVEKKYKNLRLDRSEIDNITWHWSVFPVATFFMKNGEKYKFLIFNKWRFMKVYQE